MGELKNKILDLQTSDYEAITGNQYSVYYIGIITTVLVAFALYVLILIKIKDERKKAILTLPLFLIPFSGIVFSLNHAVNTETPRDAYYELQDEFLLKSTEQYLNSKETLKAVSKNLNGIQVSNIDSLKEDYLNLITFTHNDEVFRDILVFVTYNENYPSNTLIPVDSEYLTDGIDFILDFRTRYTKLNYSTFTSIDNIEYIYNVKINNTNN